MGLRVETSTGGDRQWMNGLERAIADWLRRNLCLSLISGEQSHDLAARTTGTRIYKFNTEPQPSCTS